MSPHVVRSLFHQYRCHTDVSFLMLTGKEIYEKKE